MRPQYSGMTFDRDSITKECNSAQRGVDVARAANVFAGTYVECDDMRRDSGEWRVVTDGDR